MEGTVTLPMTKGLVLKRSKVGNKRKVSRISGWTKSGLKIWAWYFVKWALLKVKSPYKVFPCSCKEILREYPEVEGRQQTERFMDFRLNEGYIEDVTMVLRNVGCLQVNSPYNLWVWPEKTQVTIPSLSGSSINHIL